MGRAAYRIKGNAQTEGGCHEGFTAMSRRLKVETTLLLPWWHSGPSASELNPWLCSQRTEAGTACLTGECIKAGSYVIWGGGDEDWSGRFSKLLWGTT